LAGLLTQKHLSVCTSGTSASSAAQVSFLCKSCLPAWSVRRVIVLQAYTDDGNHKQQPIMIHRAIFGSIERFFGILIENCAGAFPLWLAPVQCRIMPVTDAVLDYAQDVVAQMREAGIRVQLDSGKATELIVSQHLYQGSPV